MDNTRKMIEELLGKLPKGKAAELVKAASDAKSAADIQAIAKANSLEITDEQAELFLRLYGEEVELPLEFLNSVSAGTDYSQGSGRGGGCWDWV